MNGLLRSDRKPTATQITIYYNRGMQQRICDWRTHQTLKQMGHQRKSTLGATPLREEKKTEARIHKNWRTAAWRNIVWVTESQFLWQHLDSRVKIWCKQHGSMDPSSLVSTVQLPCGLMVYRIFSWHTFGPLVPIEHCLDATAKHVHPCMTTVYSIVVIHVSATILLLAVITY